ncbi:MAG: imidazole glycerol phosphate synthase subunit HisH [Coriobacteriales bacterium]|jgi:glutamine amidotransferase|nr:imidazole glycerol phosphate synthase subunit HisH [Coriobacteriales bacterium]
MALVVVDYCKGNLRSVQKGLELAGAAAIISAEPADILAAKALVLPGVGSFADASAFMQQSGQMQAIRQRVAEGAPFLGICLGLQLLFERGDEGLPAGEWAEGLGFLRGSCKRIASETLAGARVKVPHVGWNQVVFSPDRTEQLAPLFAGIENGSNFYFTHSYQGDPTDVAAVLAEVTHARRFPCVLRKDRVFGVQFHPEKSSHKGLAVLANFVRYVNEVV